MRKAHLERNTNETQISLEINLDGNFSKRKIANNPNAKVKNIFNAKPLEIIEWNNIKGICEIIANTKSLKKYLLRLLVWVYPSVIWYAKIGKAILPI